MNRLDLRAPVPTSGFLRSVMTSGAVYLDERSRNEQNRFSVPYEALVASKTTPEEFRAKILLAASVKLYELGRLSSSAAAKLAGIPRAAFLAKLADNAVGTFTDTAGEVDEDAPTA